MEKEISGEIKNLLGELFSLIGIDAKVEVTTEKGEKTFYIVKIDDTESAGLLIGSHGLTLSAIQSFIAIAIKQKTGEWVNITLDISDWSKKQNERLEELAKQTAERAKQTKEDQKLYNLNPMQRRIVHMALSTDSEIETFSEGEKQDRYLVVKVK